jgi:hypothetical protein
MASLSIKEIIEERGGAKVVAEALSTPERRVPKTTVRSWCDANKLPWWREDAVMALPLRPKEPKADDAQQQSAA